MRIIAIGDGLFEDKRGGGRRYLSEVRSRLIARGHRVDAVVPRIGSSVSSHLGSVSPDGSRVLRHDAGRGLLPFALLGRYRSAQRAFEAGVSGGCDLVNVHFAQSAFAALRSRRASGLPIVYNFQGPWPGEVWIERRAARSRGQRGQSVPDLAAFAAMYMVERAVVKRSSRFIVLSAYSRETLRRWYGVKPDRVAMIPGGVDVDLFRPHPDRRRLRSELGHPADAVMLFTARRLVSRMGIELLLEALAEVARHVPVRLYVAGSGPLRQLLARRAAECGVADAVVWLEGIEDEDLVRYYQAADVVVVPTVAYEGFGLVTVEALACGTPVVATPVAASPEVLAELDPSLIAGSVEPAALADAILRALSRAPERERCRSYAEAHFSWDAVVPLIEAEFQKAAALP